MSEVMQQTLILSSGGEPNSIDVAAVPFGFGAADPGGKIAQNHDPVARQSSRR